MNPSPRERFALGLYRTLLYVGAPTIGPLYLAYRALSGKSWTGVGERLRWASPQTPGLTRPILVHAVSVGEVLAAKILIGPLRQACGGVPIHLSATTAAGRALAVAAHAQAEVEEASPSPLDFPGAVARHLDRVRPALFVLMEAELWPNWLHEAKRRGIPVALVNARISERSVRGYGHCPSLFAPAIRALDVVAARGADDAERLLRLGVDPARLFVTGDLKFDSPVPAWSRAEARRHLRLPDDVPVWVAGSVHPGEDDIVVDAFERLRRRFPRLTLVLAPRKTMDAPRSRQRVVRRTSGATVAAGEILLLDTIGELRDSYAAADLAFVGGSLVATGGHNLLEAAAVGVPVLFGPHTHHHGVAADRLVAAGGGTVVGDVDQLAAEVGRLLAEPESRELMGVAGRRVVEAGRGSTRATVEVLQRLLDRTA